MPTIAKKSGVEVARSNPSTRKGPDLASESVPDTLAALHVKQETGLTGAEADARRKEHGQRKMFLSAYRIRSGGDASRGPRLAGGNNHGVLKKEN